MSKIMRIKNIYLIPSFATEEFSILLLILLRKFFLGFVLKKICFYTNAIVARKY